MSAELGSSIDFPRKVVNEEASQKTSNESPYAFTRKAEIQSD
jgi:hypothetical protein